MANIENYKEVDGFRCPVCGQAHEMHITVDDVTTVITMNKEMDALYVNEKHVPAGTLKVDGDIEIACPKCTMKNRVQEWIIAFDDPTMFFDMEQLCHCGGELWMDQIPGTSKYGFVCEKCEWVKPNRVVNGG